jgi:hypothetical protein
LKPLSLFLKISTHLFLAETQSEFKIKTMLETRQNFENRLCSRNSMYKGDMMVWVWNSAMYGTSDVKVMLPNACRG